MIHNIIRFAEIVAAAGAISGIGYNLLCVWSAVRFLEAKAAGKACPELVEGSARPTQPKPAISILKPLKGIDPGMYESFRSFCLQDYPAYEIIFGVTDANDPAVALVERLKAEFPGREIRLIVCERQFGANIKVGNLAQMVSVARHDYLFVSDGDIRVGPDYLSRVVDPLLTPATGLVTCLYCGVAEESLGSRLESLGISVDFVPGVLAARIVENGIHFGLGSTLAFRRGDLAAIGGFESLADYLADDYELGKRISEIGLKVALSDEIVETFVPRYSFVKFIQHQLRWGRTVRGSRPWGFAGLIFTFAFPWALAAIVFSDGRPWAWGLGCAALILRMVVAMTVGRNLLKDETVVRLLWLIPVRDILAVWVWAGSFAGNTIVWRGDRFTIKNRKLSRL
jgi:ceramide glucosyltransferase